MKTAQAVNPGTVFVTINGVKDGMSSGYTVLVYNADGSPRKEYSAGGNPSGSQEPGISPVSTVRKWALRTAVDMYQEEFGRRPKPGEMEIEVEKA